ncbi:HD domain-containing phosphohydrolase [Pseudothermotoga sp.]|uniref:HD domain-containing phosphohydrolase n=1 Tax=Pseudothermotoga sp. TaxID=2033661 RepID=UPI0031F6A5CF
MKLLLIIALMICSFSFSITVRVGIYNNPPQVFLSNGQPAGLYIEVLEKIAKENGWKLDYVFSTFPEHLENLKNGKIDVLVSIAYTYERAQIYDYNNETLLLNWGVLCVDEKFSYRDITDLAGKTIAISKSDVYGQAFIKELRRYSVEVELIEVSDYPDVLQAVKEKRAVGGIVSRIYAAQNYEKFNVKITGTIFSPVELRFAFPKDSPLNKTLIPAIDKALEVLKSDERAYSALLARYLGMEKQVVPRWLAIAFLVVGISAVGFASWTMSLRTLVRLRTKQLTKANEELQQLHEEALAQNQEISALNEQLQSTFTQLEDAVKKFTDMIWLLSNVSADAPREEFYERFLLATQKLSSNSCVVLLQGDVCLSVEDDSIKKVLLSRSVDVPEGISQVSEELSRIAGKHFDRAFCINIDDEMKLVFLYADKFQIEPDLAKGLASVLSLYTRLKKHEEMLISLSEGIAQAFLKTLEFHEQYTAKHSETVKSYAFKMARKLNLDENETRLISCAAMIHDMGKLAIPKTILNKPEKLSPDEFELVKQHPVVAAEIVKHIKGLEDLATIIRHHHERWDGTGYPDGLAGEDIPLGARIICIADAFEAMTSDRPYRKAMSVEEAVSELLSNAGKQFDPQLVKIFLEILSEERGVVFD